MKNVLPEKIDVFLVVNPQAIEEHFNKNDPSPYYKRQLSHEFEEYINRIKAPARRLTVIEYKVTCKTEEDKQYTEPLIYAIRRHFSDGRPRGSASRRSDAGFRGHAFRNRIGAA